ncbi:MAG: hypothetical protein STSR0009_04940 [Methanoregula sp.]
MGNLSFTLAAQNISGVDYEPFAVWNTSTAIWTFPPEFTVRENDGQGVTAVTSIHKIIPLNMSLNRWVNQTRFSETGTQLLTANITFTSTDFLDAACIVDIPYTTRVHARFIPGSFVTDAPVGMTEVYDQWIMFVFNRTEIKIGVPYTLSVITQVEPNGNSVEFMPRISASQWFNFNSTSGNLSPVGIMPVILLPEPVTTASAAINVSTFWNFYMERDNSLATLDCVIQPVSLVPIANFTANVTSGTAPLTVKFTDTSTGAPNGWNWSFGDGNFSTLQHPVYTYTSIGTHSVSLNATNAVGSNTTTRINYITVNPSGSGGSQLIVSNVSLYQNTATQIPIRVTNITGGTGISFNLTYNPSVIQVSEITLNQSYVSGSSLTVNATPGLIRIVLTRTESINIGSPVPVFFVNTTGIGTAGSSTPLTVSSATWSDGTFNNRQFDTVNGTVLVYRIRGDLNGNGWVDIGDTAKTAYMVVGLTPDLIPDADFNNNGRIDVGDATKIAGYLVGKITEL